MGGCISLATASQGGKVAWVVPTYKNGRPLWRWAESAVAPLRKAGLAEVSRTDRMISFTGGGFLGIYSADNPDSVRGEAFHVVIVDEAARIPEEVWTDAIQPTLADVGGDAILISTPKGRNWFWLEHNRGASGGDVVASWTAPSIHNPNPRIQAAALLARERVPERTYRQEWLAEFVEDGGGVFQGVRACATATPQTERIQGHEHVMGVDWGKVNDATVISVIDITAMQQVYVQRLRQIDYHLQLQMLQHVYQRFKPGVVRPERNSMGEPLVEQLIRMGMPVRPFVTTNETKAEAIEALQLAFQNKTIRILPDDVQLAELEAYEILKRTTNGQPVYGAPQGMHDDYVMALAFAYSAASAPKIEVEFF